MALYRCGSSGGTLSETSLYHRDPASIGEHTITLPQPYTDFTYLRFEYQHSPSNTTMHKAVFVCEDLKNLGTYKYAFGGNSNTSSYCRVLTINSTTSFTISKSNCLGTSASGTDRCILVNIIGLK